jgi:hypothetical protein
MAVLSRGPGAATGTYDLLVGPPPATFPAVLLPPGTRPDATALAEGSTTVVGTQPSLSASDLHDQLPRLLEAGWWTIGPRARGFVVQPSGSPLTVCRDHEFATLAFVAREAGGVYVRATVRTDPRQSCVARPDFSFPDVNIPVLSPPADARVVGGGGSGGSADEMYSRSRLETTATPRSVSEHYLPQFERAGWRVDGRTDEGVALSVTRFSTTSKIGDAITGLLLVTRLAGTDDLDLIMHVVRNQMSRGRPAPASASPGLQRGTTGMILAPR